MNQTTPQFEDRCSACGRRVTRLLREGRPARVGEYILTRDHYEGTTTPNGRWITSCCNAAPVAKPWAVEVK